MKTKKEIKLLELEDIEGEIYSPQPDDIFKWHSSWPSDMDEQMKVWRDNYLNLFKERYKKIQHK